jgi:hypothetical protein
VPSSIIGRIGEDSSLRIYVQAQDPWVFTDFPGFDPESSNNDGNNVAGVPSYRTLLVGASVGF